MAVTIQLRKGLASQWAANSSIVLASGEPGFEIDTGRLKIGNGSTQWGSLQYASIIPSGFIAGSGIGINLGTNGSTANISVSGSFVANSGTFNQVVFNTGLADPNLLAGQLQWNSTEGTLDLGLNDNYAMHLGEEMLYRVRNTTGSTLLAGSPVYASGLSPGGNNRIEVNLYAADGTIREIRFMGLITEDLPNGGNNGYATHFGYIRGIDTRGDAATYGTTNKLWSTGEPAWNEGDILYVHPTVPGKLTKIEPKHSISVAIVTNVASNGKLFVRPTSYGHLDDNHDVNVSGVTNGQYLQYNSSTGYWIPTSSGTFSIVNVDNLRLDDNTLSSTSGNIIINPSGTGALQRDSGGNARGEYAVDWQTVRSTGTMVAAGSRSVIGGGSNNTSSGYYSTVGGGKNNTASATDSFIGGGRFNTSSGTYGSTVCGGRFNTSSGMYSSTVCGGKNNTASATDSFIGGGVYNTSSGYASVIGGGRFNTSSGYCSAIGGGRYNISSNERSTIGGGYRNTSSGNGSTVAGGGWYNASLAQIEGNTASATISTVGGGALNNASGHASTVGGGRLNTSSGYGSTVGGGSNNTSSGGYGSTVGGGTSNTSSGYYSTVGGGRQNTSSAIYATVGGGGFNTSSGFGSTVGGGNSNTSSGTHSTVGGGQFNTSSGTRSTVSGGRNNTSSGYSSTVGGGRYNASSGSDSTVGGGKNNTSSGYVSTVPGGIQAKTTRYGELSHAAGSFLNNGDAQHTILVARRSTTNATANQVLFLDGSSARLTLPAETTWAFSIKLSAYNDTDNEGGWWIFRGGIRRNAANGTALIGSLITENGVESSLSTASASVVADDANEALEIRVTGVASKNIRWVAVVDISQVSWGTP